MQVTKSAAGLQVCLLQTYIPLSQMCQTQARGPNLARSVIIIGPRDHIKCALELARGIYGAANTTNPAMLC